MSRQETLRRSQKFLVQGLGDLQQKEVLHFHIQLEARLLLDKQDKKNFSLR